MNMTIEGLIGKKFPVLDDGHVILLDVMGDDQAISGAARTSYGKGTRKVSEDRDLIRYLMRHRHTTPFEMAEIKIHVRVPMDCWRQWIRHRTASVNEYSTRYSEAIDSAQKTPPDAWRSQSAANKQGSSGFLPRYSHQLPDDQKQETGREHWTGQQLSEDEDDFHRQARTLYEVRIRSGVAREQARKDLPLSTYTEAVWKCDLKNTLGFLALRMDPHAQWEIRQYADIIGRQIIATLFPDTWRAFEDYTLNSVTLSALDIEVARQIAAGDGYDIVLRTMFGNDRERDECRAKLCRLGLIAGD